MRIFRWQQLSYLLRVLPTVLMTACSDSAFIEHRDKQLEAKVAEFFKAGDRQLEIKNTGTGDAIERFCILEPYHSRLTDKENAVVAANEFLEKINLLPEEDYWHILLKANDKYSLVRLRQASIPLLTPTVLHMKGGSCIPEKSIILLKTTVPGRDGTFLKLGVL